LGLRADRPADSGRDLLARGSDTGARGQRQHPHAQNYPVNRADLTFEHMAAVDAFLAARLEQWQRAASSTPMVTAFKDGRPEVEAFLKDAQTRDAKVKAWKDKYAADGTQDAAVIRERVYQDIGGTDRDPAAGSAP
jgi:hypothetical protein